MAKICRLLLLLHFIQEVRTQCKDIDGYVYKPNKNIQNRFCGNWVRNDKTRCNLYDKNHGTKIKNICRKTCKNCPGATGKICAKHKECVSGICKKGTCYASKECRPLNDSVGVPFFQNTIVLVFVGSGFATMMSWVNQVRKTFEGIMSDKFPFISDPSTRIQPFFVRQRGESFCRFGCAGIDRLLCCNVTITKDLASKCFTSSTRLQTIVIHNDKRTGGAGYPRENIATISTYKNNHLFALHELGHSLLELGDEYPTSVGSTAENMPNCDVKNCPKWSDLDTKLKLGGTLCKSKGCEDGLSYVGKNSFMRDIFKDPGVVNLRYSCCTHLALTKIIPEYCEEYDFYPGLVAYCQNDYQGYGGKSVYLPTSQTDIDLAVPVMSDVCNSDHPLEYYLVGYPINLYVNINKMEFRIIVGGSADIYRRRQIYGDFPCGGTSEVDVSQVVTVEINMPRTGTNRTLSYLLSDVVVVPPLETNEVGSVEIEADFLHIVVDGRQGETEELITGLSVESINYQKM